MTLLRDYFSPDILDVEKYRMGGIEEYAVPPPGSHGS
jgi:hypothetical protein